MSFQRLIAGLSLARLSAAIVAVGLLTGTVLYLYSSMRNSEVSAEITLLSKFEASAKEFSEKYGYLPGDLPATLALQLRFAPRNGSAGRGDGNGLIEGAAAGQVSGTLQTGEPLFFWEDLFSADMIKTDFHTATDGGPPKEVVEGELDSYLPGMNLKKGDYIYVYSDGRKNYYGLSDVSSLGAGGGEIVSRPGLSVKSAFNIDKKLDDGAPGSGKVLARYVSGTIRNAATGTTESACIDSKTGGYSLSRDGGRGINCGLSYVLADH